MSSIALVVVIIETNFFERTFGVNLAFPARNGNGRLINRNDPQLHMIVYLQVAIISQALIFVTRAHGFFFMERPSFALLGAFAVAQLVSSIIAAYGNWGFTDIQVISGGWIGIVWVWVRVLVVLIDWQLRSRSSRISYGSSLLTGSSSSCAPPSLRRCTSVVNANEPNKSPKPPPPPMVSSPAHRALNQCTNRSTRTGLAFCVERSEGSRLEVSQSSQKSCRGLAAFLRSERVPLLLDIRPFQGPPRASPYRRLFLRAPILDVDVVSLSPVRL